LQKKVTAKELEELVRGERKVPLIVDFYATWCGPCVLMAQDIEMVYVPCKSYVPRVVFASLSRWATLSDQMTSWRTLPT
jgi:thioredoxin-like negative regulator of GroEL